MLYAELAYGVVHEDREVFHRHPHVPIAPAALIWPVLVALVLGRDDSRESGIKSSCTNQLFLWNAFKAFPNWLESNA